MNCFILFFLFLFYSPINIQYHKTNTADERKANQIEKIKDYILKHTIDDAIGDDDPFYFGLKFNENSELDIGDGTKDQHCNIMCTSNYLLKTLNREGVGHIDGIFN